MPIPRGNIIYGTPQTAANVASAGTVAWTNPSNATGATFDSANSGHYAAASMLGTDETNGLALTNIDWNATWTHDPVAIGFQLSMEGSVSFPNQVSAVQAVLRQGGATIGNSLHSASPWVNQRVSARANRTPIGPIFEGTLAEWGVADLTAEDMEDSTFGAMARFGFSSASALTLRAYGMRMWGIYQGTPEARIRNLHNNTLGEQTVNVESPGAFHFSCWDSIWGQNFPKDAKAEVEILEAPAGWGYSYSDPRQIAAVAGATHDCRRYRWAKYYAIWIPPGTTGTFKLRFRVTLPFPTRQVIESPIITLNVTPASGLQERWVESGASGNGQSSSTPYGLEAAITEIEANPSTKFLVRLKRGETHTPTTTCTLTLSAARTALLCFSTWGSGARPIWASPNASSKAIDLISSDNIHFESINFTGAASTVFTIGVADVADFTLFDCVLAGNNGLEFTSTGANIRHLLVNTHHTFRRYGYFNEGQNGYAACILGCTFVETSDSTATAEGAIRLSASIAASGDNTYGRLWHVGYSSHRTRANNGKKFLRPGWGSGECNACFCDRFGFAENGDAGYLSAQYENSFEGIETPGSTLQACAPEEGAVGFTVANCVLYQDQDADGWSIAGQTWNRHTFRGNIIIGTAASSSGIFGTIDAVSSQFLYTSVLANLEFINNAMVVNRSGAFTGTFWRANLAHASYGEGTNNFQNNIYCGQTATGFRDANVSLNISGWNALASVDGDELINIPPTEFTAGGNYMPNSGTYTGYYDQEPDPGNLVDIRGLYRDVGAVSVPAGPVGLESNPDAPTVVATANDGGATLTITGDTTEYIVYFGTTSGDYTRWFTDFADGDSLTGLENGQTYYVKVAARDSLGNISALSSEVSFTPAASGGGGGDGTLYNPAWAVRGHLISGGRPGAPWLPWYPLDLDAEVSESAVVEGLVLHMNASGYLELGTGTTGASSAPMTFVVVANGYDYDAVGPDGGLVGVRVSESGDVTYVPRLVALPTTATVEFDSSVFVPELDYTPGALLTADAEGRLTLLSEVTGPATVVGVVTQAPYGNVDGVEMLRFMTVFMPNRQV